MSASNPKHTRPQGSRPRSGGAHAAPSPKGGRLPSLVFGLVFLLGFALLMYPLVSSSWNSWTQSRMVSDYEEQAAQVGESASAAWFEAADAYNATLTGKGIPDAFAFHEEDEDAEYAAQLAFREDGMMGYLDIPRISQTLPIYHTTGEDSLARGVGHLQGSALPVGGPDTHCVLSAHRGLPSAALFTDLDQLEVGDKFFMYVLDRSMAYEVDQVLVVEPEQTESLAIEPGEDYVTLVTCTPYSINSHRLLVRGHRVPYEEALAEADAAGSVRSIFTQYWLWIALGLAVVALVMGLLRAAKRKREEAASRARVRW